MSALPATPPGSPTRAALTPDGRHPALVPPDWARHVDPAEWRLGPDGLPFRRAGRVLVITRAAEALLLAGHDHADSSHSWLFTPGGGIQPGEDARTAAARELAEESGIVVDPSALEGPVARRDAVFRFASVACRQDETYFLLHLQERVALENEGWTDLERDVVDTIGWWTSADLEAAAHAGREIYPSAMPTLVRTLSRGWDGRGLDLTESADAELVAQIGAAPLDHVDHQPPRPPAAPGPPARGHRPAKDRS
ncbi:NUDIX hydrolase [Actinomyces howellii]|uniref:RNA pyrophosphohydrolase n=1 Tax=Actinomyces howellii TaxID=52771 RepID=A0A448HE21_9ACTO|nr:RNA pyrophosphohydrolase [Actinomyces howellii]